ncbi:MAG: phosphoglucosamine mutase [Candidatus Bathyarchaeia archaeon]
MPKLFGTAGIRGNILTKVTPELALRFGAALATHLKNAGDVAVGHDNRTSSKMLEAAVTSGLIYGGCNVALLGLVPLPVLAFQTRLRKTHAGIMITASHNPPTDNGLKCFDGQGMEYTPNAEEALESLITTRMYQGVSWEKLGNITEICDVKEQYIEAVLQRFSALATKIRVVVDCANGATCDVAPVLLRRMGCQVVAINDHPDGFFPGRPLEPSPENLQVLSRIVRETRADIGVAYDGDGDRLALVDERGRFVLNDRVIALSAMKLLEEAGGGSVITSIDTSFCIDEVAEKFGGIVHRTKLGKTYVGLKEKVDAVMAAEPWKIIDPRWGLWGDGIYSAARIIKMLDESDKTVTQLFADIPSYPQCRLSFACPDEKKARVMDLIDKEAVRDKNVASVWTFDGTRVNYADGSWLLLRASGTEPKVRLYAEGKTEQRLRELVKRGKSLLKQALA